MENHERFCRSPEGKIVFFARKSVGVDESYPCQHLYGFTENSSPQQSPEDFQERDVWGAFAGMVCCGWKVVSQIAKVPRKIKDCGDIEKAIAIIGKYSDVRPSETVWSEERLLNSAGIGVQDKKEGQSGD